MDVGRIRTQPAAADGPLSRGAPRHWIAACWRQRWLRRLFAAAAIIAVLYVTSSWWLPAAGRWLDVGESPRISDYCLVLSGDYESRPFVAAALYRRGFVRNQIWLTHAAMADTAPVESEESNDAPMHVY